MDYLVPDDELRNICGLIVAEQLSERQWAEREADDTFQSERYSGGYDADEHAFCFSRYGVDGKEAWFQLSLAEVEAVAEGGALWIVVRPSTC